MKFNRTEMGLLACQPGHRFEKEGVMFIRERQDGFFRRNESKFKCLASNISSDFVKSPKINFNKTAFIITKQIKVIHICAK